ncbi:MAG: hypothetical protein ABIA47_02080, partial [bacterium]
MEKRDPGQPKVEKERSPEEEKQQAFFGAVLQWVDKLTTHRPPKIEKKLSKLPRSLDLGAAFLPTVLMTVMTACHPRETGEIIECTDSESEYILAMMDWINDHPDEIQHSMNELWPDASVDAEEIISTLNNANIECGLYEGTDTAGEALLDSNTIIVGVDVDRFEISL